jgi:hypothetical protein
MQKIEMHKQYKTRGGGHNARVLCVDVDQSVYPVAAAVRTNGREEIRQFTSDGRFLDNGEHAYDLIEVKQFVFIPEVGRKYKDTDGFVYTVLLTNVHGAYPVMLGLKVKTDTMKPFR